MAGRPQLQGTVFKKCDMAGHRPDTRKDCKAGTCQHTCADVERCSHKWTLRYTVNGKQTEKSLNPGTKARKVADALKTALAGQPPGSPVPTDTSLATQHQCSYATVNTAKRALAEDGTITKNTVGRYRTP
jgi:hypothetical protein